MPTVGAGSSQREDSPAHRLHPPCGSPPPAATPAMRIPATPPIAATIPAPSPYHRRTNQRPTPYQPKTCVASCSDFALRRNPRMQRRWYGDGTAKVRRISGDAPWLGAKVGAAVPCVAGRSGDTGDPALAGVAEKTPVMCAVFFVTTFGTPPFFHMPFLQMPAVQLHEKTLIPTTSGLSIHAIAITGSFTIFAVAACSGGSFNCPTQPIGRFSRTPTTWFQQAFGETQNHR